MFEVASVKPNKSGDQGGRLGGPASRFMASNVPVRQLLLFAYQVQPFQIDGAPKWIDDDRFDVETRASDTGSSIPVPGGPPSATQLKLRTLLVERFKLAVHRQTKEMPIYALVMARSDRALGRELQRSETDCAARLAAGRRDPPPSPTARPACGITTLSGRIAAGATPMPRLTAILSNLLQRQVVDRTGLAGNFDFEISFSPDVTAQGAAGPDPPAIEPNAPSLFTAIQEQLGLKLEATRGPIDVLVVEHIEKPSED